jgi:hypothetical protein
VINLEVEGADAINKTLDTMASNINEFGSRHMAAELTAWQSEDMRRQYPNTKQDDEKTVSTEIYPRSRLSQKRKPSLIKKPLVRVYAKPRGGTGAAQVQSTRPILRESLWERLCERMAALMSETLKWITG